MQEAHILLVDNTNPNTLYQSPRQNASEKSVCIYNHTIVADDNTLYQSQRQNASEERLCIYKQIMVADDNLTATCWMDLLPHNPESSLQICLTVLPKHQFSLREHISSLAYTTHRDKHTNLAVVFDWHCEYWDLMHKWLGRQFDQGWNLMLFIVSFLDPVFPSENSKRWCHHSGKKKISKLSQLQVSPDLSICPRYFLPERLWEINPSLWKGDQFFRFLAWVLCTWREEERGNRTRRK